VISELAQAIKEPKRLEDSRVDADTHRRVAALNPLQRRAARKSALSDDARRQPPAAASIAHV